MRGYMSVKDFYTKDLSEVDADLFAGIQKELERQQYNIELIRNNFV